MTCDESRDLIALAALGALPSADAVGLDRHLGDCEACRRVAQADVATTALLPSSLDPVAPPARLRAAIMEQVHAESGAGTTLAEPNNGIWRRLWNGLPSSRALTAGSSIAALGLAAALIITVSRPPQTIQPQTATVITLAGTTTTPGVNGRLTVQRDTGESTVVVTGLPDPVELGGKPASTYELWFIPEHGAPVAAGFLTHTPGATTWSAAVTTPITGFRTVAATIEPPGGTTAPSGPQVLSGQLA